MNTSSEIEIGIKRIDLNTLTTDQLIQLEREVTRLLLERKVVFLTYHNSKEKENVTQRLDL